MNKDAQKIIKNALEAAMPGTAVAKALQDIKFGKGRIIVVAAGKAAWEMGRIASYELRGRKGSACANQDNAKSISRGADIDSKKCASQGADIDSKKCASRGASLNSKKSIAGGLGEGDCGIIITKYGHSKGDIDGFEIYEAGHPVPDENSYKATARALELVSDLTKEDNVLFLLSGGGSALFEKPLVSEEEMADITKQLLASGADITEMNTIRKRLSGVKGGKFAQACSPAHVFTVVLSDIIGDPLDMIASGPAYPDSTTAQDAERIIKAYKLRLSKEAMALIKKETPKKLGNVTTYVTGSVKQLCASAAATCKELGYEPVVLTSSLCCEARDAGEFLGCIARDHQDEKKSIAYIAGGETVVHLKGKGLGGRNQEIALAAAPVIAGCKGTTIFSFGSDGTDGPTDAAGGIVDGSTMKKLAALGIDPKAVLENNDAYHALSSVKSLIITGPTGTNVNDLSVVLIKR